MKISNILKEKIFDVLGEEVLNRLENLKYAYGDYLDIAISDDSRLSYIPNNAIEKFESLSEEERRDYRKNKGIFIKLSKLLTIAGYSNKEVSEMAAKFASFTFRIKAEMMPVEEVYKFCYNNKTLYGCMNEKYEQLSEFYNCFPVKAALFKCGDLVVGRALFWEKVYFEGYGEYPFLDRIYTNYTVLQKDNYQNANHDKVALSSILAYAKIKGWVTKKYQNAENKTSFILPTGEEFTTTATVEANKEINIDEFVPYIDTFSYINDVDGYIKNTEENCIYIANNTDGSCNMIYAYTCNNCGEGITEDEAIIINEDNIFCSHYCANRAGWYQSDIINKNGDFVDTEWVYEDDDYYVYVPEFEAYTAYYNAETCDICDETILKTKAEYANVANFIYGYFRVSELCICKDCSKNYKKGATLIYGEKVYEDIWLDPYEFDNIEFHEKYVFEDTTYDCVYVVKNESKQTNKSESKTEETKEEAEIEPEVEVIEVKEVA